MLLNTTLFLWIAMASVSPLSQPSSRRMGAGIVAAKLLPTCIRVTVCTYTSLPMDQPAEKLHERPPAEDEDDEHENQANDRIVIIAVTRFFAAAFDAAGKAVRYGVLLNLRHGCCTSSQNDYNR